MSFNLLPLRLKCVRLGSFSAKTSRPLLILLSLSSSWKIENHVGYSGFASFGLPRQEEQGVKCVLPFWAFLVWGGWRLKLNRHLSNWGTPGWQTLLWGLRFFLQVIDNCPAQVLVPKTHFMLFYEGLDLKCDYSYLFITYLNLTLTEFRIVQKTHINSNFYKWSVCIDTSCKKRSF